MKRAFLISIVIVAFLAVILIMCILLLGSNTHNIIGTPTKSPTIFVPNQPTNTPTPSTTTDTPTSSTITIAPSSPPVTKGSYPKIVFKSDEDFQSNIKWRLPNEFAPVASNPYYLSQVSLGDPMKLSTTKVTTMMDFIQPLSGFPVNRVQSNHIPFTLLEGYNITVCKFEFADRKAGVMPGFINDYFTKVSKGEFKPNVNYFTPSTSKTCGDSSRSTRDQLSSQCNAQCNKNKCNLQAIYFNECFAGQGGTSNNKNNNDVNYNSHSGSCHTKHNARNIAGHECGHGLGLDHSSIVYYAPEKAKSKYSNYNAISDYGTSVCLMGHESLYFQPATLFHLGWVLKDFVYIQDDKTITLRTATNFDMGNNYPVSLVMLDPYTGSKIFFSYHIMTQEPDGTKMSRPPKMFKNSEIWLNGYTTSKGVSTGGGGFVAVVTPLNAQKPYQIGFWKTKEYTTPYGWHFSVVYADANYVTVKTTFKKDSVLYYPSPVEITQKQDSPGHTTVTFIVSDSVPQEPMTNWPRFFTENNAIVSSTGTIFPCTLNSGSSFPRLSTNKNIYTCPVTSSLKEEIFIFTLNIATHAQTKKVLVQFL